MGIDFKAVSNITDTVSKIKPWAKEHKGLILIVAVVIVGIASFFYIRGRKKESLSSKSK
jgi:hypothetical protein